MKKVTFNIQNRKDTQPVEGYLLVDFPKFPAGSVAVHRKPGYDKSWKVSHIPTGYAISPGWGYNTRKQAIEKTIERVNQVDQAMVDKCIASAPVIN